jgi:hypothetical protein
LADSPAQKAKKQGGRQNHCDVTEDEHRFGHNKTPIQCDALREINRFCSRVA